VKRDVKCRLARGRRRHALADGAHVAVDALDSLIRVLATRQARASCVHLPVRLLGRSALAMTRLAKLLGGCRSFDCCCGSLKTASPWNAWQVMQLAPAFHACGPPTWSCHCVRLFLPRPSGQKLSKP